MRKRTVTATLLALGAMGLFLLYTYARDYSAYSWYEEMRQSTPGLALPAAHAPNIFYPYLVGALLWAGIVWAISWVLYPLVESVGRSK
jgi:predicted benzoate:H+ symporter BenE